ncbi:MAG: uracil-DNA glycosylase [Bacilli bacterium]|nr:uracil-DNA glycosylase [Bacilli bacterium]
MENWSDFLALEKKKEFFLELQNFIKKERENYVIFPKEEDVFKAFELTNLKDIKVVIFGQDPYPNVGQAMGLAFSVPKDIKLPPSLKNIYKEIETEFGKEFINRDGDLTYLAKQGVLLLNPILTVREKEPLSHDNELYKRFFIDVIEEIEHNDNPIVYLLFGGKAHKYEKYITNKNHLVIKTNHPSPLSANRGGWFGSNCFKEANNFLIKNQIKPIEWLK